MAGTLHVCSCPSSYRILGCAAEWHCTNLLTVLVRHEITHFVTLSKDTIRVSFKKKKKKNLKAYLRNWRSGTQLQALNPLTQPSLVGGKRLRTVSPNGP